ncbi:MAG: IS4 family transposase [Euryarchaeota archaeon]|nr:IS4 family transposase [Euryarchaeota archaeon]
MFNSIHKRISYQIIALRLCFAQIDGLPFSDILSAETIRNIMDEEVGSYRDRIYSPLITLSAFLSQVLSSDHSCRNAVAKVLAERVAQGESPCSSNTKSYCKARFRLPTSLVRRLVRETGKLLHLKSEEGWKWKGRSVKLVDGTTVSMPDTPENQKTYPQPEGQKPGVGFPIARIVAIISLSCGAVLDVAIGPYKGKETGEHALLRQILDSISAGDIILGDRYYCSYFLIVMLQWLGADSVFRIHGSRKSDFRRGKHLGKKDHIVIWKKPKQRPNWMTESMYLQMPDTITIREIKINKKVITTTLLDPKKFTREEIDELYTKRWLIEVDFRFIKTVLQMDILRCKTPDMVCKEIWVNLLAYNLIRTVMAQAAHHYNLPPRTLSFKGTLQQLNAFKERFLRTAKKHLSSMYEYLLEAIVRHRVGNRHRRSEPRAVKRRRKPYPLLTKPREEARNELWGGGGVSA